MISIIVAMSEEGVIGGSGRLPWDLPSDLARFEALTSGHCVIMGRKTFESVGGPLVNRRCIVMTRQREYRAEGAIVVHGVEEAVAAAGDDEEAFIIGGGEVYRLFLPRADRLYLTVVHGEGIAGDTYFPEVSEEEWPLVEEVRHEADDRHGRAYSFRRYDRRAGKSGGDVGAR